MKKSLVIISPYTTRSGYGQHSRLIIQSLINSPEITNEYDISLISTKWGGTPISALDSNKESDAALLRLNLPQNQLNFVPDVSIQISIPSEFQRIGKYSIGITAGTEASIAPVKFVEGCNVVDLVITPSKFTKDVLLTTVYDKKDQQGNVIDSLQVTKPVEVLFEGVDTNVYNKQNIDTNSDVWSKLNKIPEDFCFLVVGHWLNGILGQDRKDIGMTIKVFLDTFKEKKNPPALILKVGTAGFSIMEYDSIINKINQIQGLVRSEGFKGRLPSIYIIHGDLSDLEMNTLYNHPKVKSLVSFTKGEGFGLPLLEFTTTGKPILCSNYSGPVDFLNKEYAVLLPGQLTNIHNSAANEWLPKEGQWFTINYQYAGMAMKTIYDSINKLGDKSPYIEKSRKQPKYTKDNFSLDIMRDKLTSIIMSKVESTPKQITLNLPKLKKV